MKTIAQLQIEQYGKEIIWESYGYNIFEYITDEKFWLHFNINYKECETKGLLSLLQTLRVYESRIKDVEKFRCVKNAIKKELSNREHIPNKKEKKDVRKRIKRAKRQ